MARKRLSSSEPYVKLFCCMESSSQNSRTSPEDDRSSRSPVLGLLLVSDNGMVFESRVSYPIGCSIELAVHVPQQKRSKSPSRRPGTVKSDFITSEGIVVSCVPRTGSPEGELVYEVTLLFSSLQKQDRRKLRHLANRYLHPMSLASTEGPSTLCNPMREPCMGLN
jgi:hypothetical protein